MMSSRPPKWPSAPASNTRRPLARDQAAPESTLALTKAASLGCERVRPLAWCSRPRDSAAPPAGALMADLGRAALVTAFLLFVYALVTWSLGPTPRRRTPTRATENPLLASF